MPFGGALTVGLIGGGASILSGLFGSSAASKASQQQVAEQEKALQFQKDVYGQQQQNQAPFLAAGQSSIGDLMQAIKGGKFGADSLGPAPTAPGAFTDTFSAPSLEDARNSPGYQFTAQQGTKGILSGAAAAGGAITGGTLKALDQFNTGLADSMYNDVFSRAMSTYNAGLQKYNANLAGYGQQLAGFGAKEGAQQQEFNQLYNTAALGEGSVQSLNNNGTQSAVNVGNLMQGIGQSQASGTVGSANAITSGLSGAANSFTQSLLLSKLLGAPSVRPTNVSSTMDYSGVG